MNPEETLQRVLEYAGHHSYCDALRTMWNRGPCDCGWEQVKAKLSKGRREAIEHTRRKLASR